MRWAYAVTTVPGRPTLDRTLSSLSAAGFDAPLIAYDDGRFGVAYNWSRALVELFLKEPRDDTRYAIFQDDVLARVGLRTYLEQWFPKDGYLNLYTAYENERDPARPATGWWVGAQKGRGALGLVFDRMGVLDLIGSQYFWDNMCGYGRKGIDGRISATMKLAAPGRVEYVHGTSLLQHTGHDSVANNGTARESPRVSSVFPGEAIDPATESRVGIGAVSENPVPT